MGVLLLPSPGRNERVRVCKEVGSPVIVSSVYDLWYYLKSGVCGARPPPLLCYPAVSLAIVLCPRLSKEIGSLVAFPLPRIYDID